MTIQPGPNSDEVATVEALVSSAFGPEAKPTGVMEDVNRGRGAFSTVLRLELIGPGTPPTAVAKLATSGPNRQAAVDSGAYRREALAYRDLLTGAPVATPTAYAVSEADDGTCALLLEDLTGHRHADQIDGLRAEDAVTVAADLARFHRSWADSPRLDDLAIRHNTVATLPRPGLAAGLTCLDTRWGDVVDAGARRRYQALVEGADRLAQRFGDQRATLCHGDPRADNLVFDRSNRTVLFDWQQMAVQFAEADLSWLAATSLDVETRRRVDDQLIAAHGGDASRYRLGFALPGLTVLLLAQRELPTERANRFVGVSLQRIAAALDDLDVVALAD
jgi:aminoglycoside phosphotransferase (APT) family kinase protein